ncbi:MAG: telomere binding protein [Piccolia ochrophora]|nr:MAG: telomere binding protein [Piccolia ochrophora]
MAELLQPVKTTKVEGAREGPHNLALRPAVSSQSPATVADVTSPDIALEILRSRPDLAALSRALTFLNPRKCNSDKFNIRLPSPQAAQILNALVESVIPDYWALLHSSSSLASQSSLKGRDIPRVRTLLLRCFSSVNGLGAILARLRRLTASEGERRGIEAGFDHSQYITDLVDVLNSLLVDDAYLWQSWSESKEFLESSTAQTLLWKELVLLVCTGKLLSAVAEAEDILRKSNDAINQGNWIGNGVKYSAWLGRNILSMSWRLSLDNDPGWTATAHALSRSLSLGYTERITEEIYSGLLLQGEPQWARIQRLLRLVLPHERKKFFLSVLRHASRLSTDQPRTLSDNQDWWQQDAKNVKGAAALVAGLIGEFDDLKDCLVTWLTNSTGGGIAEGLALRRAVIAATSPDTDTLQAILEKSMQQFGDNLYIKHTPILHQEVNAQNLLLAAGYVHRSTPMFLFTLARSSLHLNAVSNRLAASSVRSHFLGMSVGTSISDLIDKPDNKMKFSMDEGDRAESEWYQSLTKVEDSIGTISDIKDRLNPKPEQKPKAKKDTSQQKHPATATLGGGMSKIISIEEINDEEDDNDMGGSDGDDDLVPYEKPDTDDEEEEDDPTLIQRDKPTAPVYIRDLLIYLRDAESFDRHRLALTSAAPLIRRKANFGTEVSDHAEELAPLLTGLNDHFSLDDFSILRLQAMIALLIALPERMGQWFARTFFEGDYSLGQRSTILTTLGMGARELAGLEPPPKNSASNFPSKALPPHLHAIYSSSPSQATPSSNPLASLSHSLSTTILQPLALSAADTLTGPAALKVRTFSSRMAVEARKPKPAANPLSKVIATAFFFPLTGRWWTHVRTSGGRGRGNTTDTLSSPHLLPTYLQTLTLVLHAAGPSTPALPQMTAEFWDLLLALRAREAVASDPAVREALLFAFLTLLELNEDKRRVAEEHARELQETMAWVGDVFGRLGEEGKGGQGGRARMLAAGVLTKGKEIVEGYQRILMGQGWEG